MNRKMSTIIITCAVVFLFSGCVEKKAQEALGNCRKIQIGMTRAEVDTLMGKPTDISRMQFRGRTEDVLYYPSPGTASTQTQLTIDCETGLVVAIVCGEGFSLSEIDAKCEKLKTGMSYEEVIKIMGKPDFIMESKFSEQSQIEEWLYFVSRRHPERITICIIDKKTGELMGTYCD